MLRSDYPFLDDRSWDWEAILKEHSVVIERIGRGWSFCWKQGFMRLDTVDEKIARQAAALFVSLWLRNISASFCDKLVEGYIVFLEGQEK